MKIIIINGVNLNLLGIRELDIYGNQTFESYLKYLQNRFKQVELDFFHSNIEGEIINKIHNVGFSYDGIILNAGAYSHTSIALYDAIKSVKTPVVEVHISNIFAREEFRHHSYVSSVSQGVIVGFGLEGYALAIQSFLK